MKWLVERYLIAAVGFAAAALWLGVGLVKGMECLLAFLLTLLVVAVVQRRQRVVERSRARRPAHSRGGSHSRVGGATDRRHERPVRRAGSRPRPSRPLYDDDADGGDWSRLVEHW